MATQPTKPTTTDAGAPVASDEHSLTVGADGPIVLNDHYLIERAPIVHSLGQHSQARLHSVPVAYSTV